MKSILLAVIPVFVLTGTAVAEWQPYRTEYGVVASYNYDTFASFQGNPSVWVRWHYDTPRKGVAGVTIHFTADCSSHTLYEIAENTYGPGGDYLSTTQNYENPKEYPVSPGSLNEDTYRLLCRP